MYSLIRSAIACYCNNDIISLIFSIYRDIIVKLTYHDTYLGSFGKTTYHITRIHWYNDAHYLCQPHAYNICGLCMEKNYEKAGRYLTYKIHRYGRRNEIEDWKYETTSHMVIKYHHACFEQAYGIIYNF